MITCKLGGKEYHIDFVSGRALREMGDAMEAYRKIVAAAEAIEKGENLPADTPSPAEMYDELVKWFCMLFRNQFTPDEVYDEYPADQLAHDIVTALLAVQNGVTKILTEFPMKPAATGEKKA